MKIPVSVIVTTKNEETKISSCLKALKDFDEIIVVDSQSRDQTRQLAERENAKIIDFAWNGQYPKKRQWCLDNLTLKYDWIFFVDADEIVTSQLVEEIRKIFAKNAQAAGYFVSARHLISGKLLKYGFQNRKLALIDRRCIEFPVVDDLDIPGMGEMEGHYQPILKKSSVGRDIKFLNNFMIHDCFDDERAWKFRHQKYARWERGMNDKNSWPEDPRHFFNLIKKILRRNPFRPQIIFFIGYVLLGGFRDGREGLRYAKKKKDYYALINQL